MDLRQGHMERIRRLNDALAFKYATYILEGRADARLGKFDICEPVDIRWVLATFLDREYCLAKPEPPLKEPLRE